QGQQARFLGSKPEAVMNLGHASTVDKLTENPARMIDYADSHASEGVVRGPERSQGVYGRFKNPESGISAEGNLDRWADYARSNSYHGSDPRGRETGSDNHLLSTKGWANLPDSGSESGPGRIEKAKRY